MGQWEHRGWQQEQRTLGDRSDGRVSDHSCNHCRHTTEVEMQHPIASIQSLKRRFAYLQGNKTRKRKNHLNGLVGIKGINAIVPFERTSSLELPASVEVDGVTTLVKHTSKPIRIGGIGGVLLDLHDLTIRTDGFPIRRPVSVRSNWQGTTKVNGRRGTCRDWVPCGKESHVAELRKVHIISPDQVHAHETPFRKFIAQAKKSTAPKN